MQDWMIVDYQRWLSTLFSESTQDIYTRAASRFSDWYRKTHINAIDIKSSDIASYLHDLQAETSIETEHVYTRALLHYLRYLNTEAEIYIDLTACEQTVSSLRRTKSHELPDVSLDTVRRIHHYAISWQPSPENDDPRSFYRDLRDRVFLLLLAETGIRVGGVMGFREKNFNARDKVLQVAQNKGTALSDHTSRAIIQYLEARRKSYPSTPESILIARHDKRASSNLLQISRWTASNIVDAMFDRAISPDERNIAYSEGNPLTPHSFRHYFVATTLSATGSLEKTQTAAHHGTSATTRKYLSLIEGDEKKK